MTRLWGNPRRFDQPSPLVKAGLLNIHMTTPETKRPRLWRWVGLLLCLLSAAMMVWLGFSVGEWIAS